MRPDSMASVMSSAGVALAQDYNAILAAPDRDILIYLQLKPGETLGGQTLDIAKAAKPTLIPQYRRAISGAFSRCRAISVVRSASNPKSANRMKNTENACAVVNWPNACAP